MQRKELKIILLAYPDNPVGSLFFKILRRNNISIHGIIVEEKRGKANWLRFKSKIKKDGFIVSIQRINEVLRLKRIKQNVVQLAEENHVPVYWVKNFNNHACACLLEKLNIDLLIISSAPILKEYIFNKAKIGCLNAHPGWLPTYRGIGANAYALYHGDATGVTVHWVDSGIDTGKIILRERLTILPKDTVSKINDRAVIRGAELMAGVIKKIQNDQIKIPSIKESKGKMYKAMPYKLIKQINHRLKSQVSFKAS